MSFGDCCEFKKEPTRVITVLIVEDSRVAAEFLTHVLNDDGRFRVVGVAVNGEEALEATQRMLPDVVTMDIHMPKINGFEATRTIMETCPKPIVIVSGCDSVDEVATTFRAMEAGALAVVRRPTSMSHPDHESARRQLLDTIALMSEVKVVKRWPRSRSTPPGCIVRAVQPQSPARSVQAVAIGASTGGPVALQTILSALPRDFSVPVLIVQHMTPGFTQGFVEWLSDTTGFPTRIATDGEPLLPGHAYVAPDDSHMGMRPRQRVLLTRQAKENGMRPAVSFLFRSVESVLGPDVIGVLLTGMGRDGAEELLRLRATGAITIAQDEPSSVVHGMPGEAINMGAASHVLPPMGIATALAMIAIQL
jgi:two-component system, chemotaxis family, protein-glutamate methylesterase/glutaminase